MSWKNLASRSRELRGGKLMANCNCTRRNGLQYDCPRAECQGHPICLTRPFPKCCPSLFANRFEQISMGKFTNPDGSRKIRVLNNGSTYQFMIILALVQMLSDFLFNIFYLKFCRLRHPVRSTCWCVTRKFEKFMRPIQSKMRTLLVIKK